MTDQEQYEGWSDKALAREIALLQQRCWNGEGPQTSIRSFNARAHVLSGGFMIPPLLILAALHAPPHHGRRSSISTRSSRTPVRRFVADLKIPEGMREDAF